MKPLLNEKELAAWFRAHKQALGFVKLLEEPTGKYHKPYPDYWGILPHRQVIRIELEVLAYNFILHGHNPQGADLLVCAEDNSTLYAAVPHPNIICLNLPVVSTHLRSVRSADIAEAVLNGKGQITKTLGWWRMPDTTRRCSFCQQEIDRRHHLLCRIEVLAALRRYVKETDTGGPTDLPRIHQQIEQIIQKGLPLLT